MPRASQRARAEVFAGGKGEGYQAPVSLSHATCHALLTAWGAVERAEIQKVCYPTAIGMFRYWEPPRDPEARLEREVARLERNWGEIHQTGWAILTLRQVHRETIKRHYRDRLPIGRGAMGAALDAFGRKFVIWQELVDGPINPL